MSCEEGHCITCSDEGIEMRVLAVDEDRSLILCADGDGAHHSVDSGVLEAPAVGDRVLVHAAVALVHLRELAA